MSAKPETVFRARFRKKLDALPNSWWESIQQQTIRGTPDIIGCLNGHFIAFEIKATEKDVMSMAGTLQEYKLSQIAQSNGMAFVVTPETEKNILDLLKNIGKDSP